MMQKIFLLIFCLDIFVASAQLPDKEKAPAQLDSIQVKNSILDFTRLVFSKRQSNIDSIVLLCSFPFYNKDWQGKRVYKSATELKADLNKIFKEEKYKPVEYDARTVFKSGSCENISLKGRQYTCFKMISEIRNVGGGNYSAILRTTFYVDNKYPFPIIGVEEVY